MKPRFFYVRRMQLRSWKVMPSFIRRKDSWKPYWVGIWARFGWRYVSIGIRF